MKKILFCASTASHLLNFHLPYLRAFHERGWQVWAATGPGGPDEIPWADRLVRLPLRKRLLSPQNIRAVFAARRLLRKERFDAVSTHTTLAGAVVRAGALLLLRGRPAIAHTSHGYLFHDAGLKKWVYLLPEKLCARVTDVLMVMNREDCAIARRHKLCRGEPIYIDGMGIDLALYHPVPPDKRGEIRRRLDLAEDDFVFVYAAEFSARKNQALLIRAFAEAARGKPGMRLLLAGDGALLEQCRALAEELGAADRVLFPGHVREMHEIYPACDVSVTSSRIEGLPFNVMESMACGLPVVASDAKGHGELVGHETTGLLYPEGDARALATALARCYSNRGELAAWGARAQKSVRRYGLEAVLPAIMKIYDEGLPGGLSGGRA